MSQHRLSTEDHDRDAAGMTYVYPVVSRRAGGVSVGVNLNVNNACNWRCAYCQVPDLVRGAAPELDLPELARELDAMLAQILDGDFLERRAPEGFRRLNDVALSGNGEPTSSHQIDAVVDIIARAFEARSLVGAVNVVVISNGSLVLRPEVLRALDGVGTLGGELWFKLDSATRDGRRRLNDTGWDPDKVRASMAAVAARCRLRVQTMALAYDGAPPPDEERAAYVDFLRSVRDDGTAIHDVLLYGLARPSLQPEAPRLSALSAAQLEAFAAEIRAAGFDVVVHP
ncbi:MAG: radical SAM protein [Myxococcales bacterium]|nr:radical SAM protein [Myxococcales bacterium]